MDSTKNSRVGKLVNDTVYKRFAAAGHTFPQLPECPLWEVIRAAIRIMNGPTTEVGHPFHQTPHGSYLWLVIATMSMTARLQPDDAPAVAGFLPAIQEALERHGCTQIPQPEADALVGQLQALVALPATDGDMGAAGEALLQLVRFSLRGATAATPARRRLLQQAAHLCKQVDQNQNLADCHALGAELFVLLVSEARRSGGNPAQIQLEFWAGFELILTDYRV